MRNAMRYIFILCLFLGFASCQEDVLQPSYKGKGRLVLKDVDISAEASAETVTRATSTFTAPTASELTYKVTDTQTGEVVYNQTGEFTSLVLDEGFYRLEASYGTEKHGNRPLFICRNRGIPYYNSHGNSKEPFRKAILRNRPSCNSR